MKLLRPGGTLVTCSCSHHVGLAEFTEVVAAAASDAGRRVQKPEVRGAAPDHPAVLTLPETSHLKCLICPGGCPPPPPPASWCFFFFHYILRLVTCPIIL